MAGADTMVNVGGVAFSLEYLEYCYAHVFYTFS